MTYSQPVTHLLPLDGAGLDRGPDETFRPLGSSGIRVFPVAVGGNTFGRTVGEDAAYGILDVYREAGGNLVDTADSYASGRSELIIGNWMRSRKVREKVVLATKIGRSDLHPGLSGSAVTAAIDASLSRLGTDRIDLLFLDLDDETVPFEETLVAVDESLSKGKVLHLGVSDHSGNRLVEARVIAAQLGLTPLVAVQCRYNLTHRSEFEGALAQVADQQGLGVLPRFALDGGFLAGNYRARAELGLSSTGEVALGGDAGKHLNRRGQRILATLDRIAQEQEVAVATVAIAWLLSKPNVVAPVVGVSTAGQIVDLAAAAALELGRQELVALDEVSSQAAR